MCQVYLFHTANMPHDNFAILNIKTNHNELKYPRSDRLQALLKALLKIFRNNPLQPEIS